MTTGPANGAIPKHCGRIASSRSAWRTGSSRTPRPRAAGAS